jgi:hypothetical protein
MQALLMAGSSRICWTPGAGTWLASECGGERREAMMGVGWASGSLGSGGRRTKWRISAAEVPT